MFKSALAFSEPMTVEPGTGAGLHAFARDLFPICRSITGDGIRTTLKAIGQRIPMTIHEIPTGTKVFDWEIPREWNIRGGYIKGPDGQVLVDFDRCNLHVVNYSTPIRARMSLDELRPHLYSLPEHPDWTPYRTSYYREAWGFCLPHRTLEALPTGEYEVCIDAELTSGHLSYGECVIHGETEDEVLLSCHACHPSLANDNLAGIAIATRLFELLSRARRRLTYRLLFVPGTIGSISWLARNEATVPRIKHGLLFTCAGDRGQFTYKRSRRANAMVDRAAAHVLKAGPHAHRMIDFFPYGYDERQYCSPAFDIPLGCLMRTPHGEYPEYHTSADDLSFISAEAMEETLHVATKLIDILENDRIVLNLSPKCEPQLGKRGLYRAMGGDKHMAELQTAYLWVLNLGDGLHSLLDMAERANLPFATIRKAAFDLEQAGLLSPSPPTAT